MQIKQFIKITAVILLHAFLLHELAFGASSLAPEAVAAWRAPHISLQIQPSVALIEETYQSPSKNAPIVYLIQDAHTNESAQLNIAKTLEELIEKENIGHVFLEGGTGDNSLSYFRAAPLAERQKLAKSLLKQGELSGWEYLDLVSDELFTLWGVENEKLYWESLQDYKQVAAGRDKFQEYVRMIESTVKHLKPKIFNPSLGAFDQKRQDYLGDKIPLTDYLEALTMEASRFQIALSYYPHLQSFQALREKERQIDFGAATQEQSRALGSFTPEDREALSISSSTAKHAPFKFSSLENADQKGFYALLEETIVRNAKMNGVFYPELSKYFNYLKEAQKLNPEKLLEEQRTLEAQVLTRLIQNKDEQELHRASENVRFLKKLFDLSLTPLEREQYAGDFADLSIERMTGFLNRQIMDLNGEAENVIFLEKGYGAYLEKALRFYALTYERDEALVRNTLKKMEEAGERKAVLIAGGFHAPHLKELFKKSGVSFMSIRPQVYHETNQKRYESILLNQIPEASEVVSPVLSGLAPVKNMAIRPTVQRPYILSQLHQGLGVARQSAGARLAAKVPSDGSMAAGSRYYDFRYDPKKMEQELFDSRKMHLADIKTYPIPISSEYLTKLAVNPRLSTQEKLEVYLRGPVAALDKFSEKFGLGIDKERLRDYVRALIQESSEQDRSALVQRFEDIKNNKVGPLKIVMGNNGGYSLSVFDTQDNMIAIDAAVLMYIQDPATIEIVLATILARYFFGVIPMTPRETSLADSDVRLSMKEVGYTKKIFEVAKKHGVQTRNTLAALEGTFSRIKEPGEVPYTSYYTFSGTEDSAKSKLKIPDLIKDRYQPLAILGQGGMGVVILAFDTAKNKKVAIKIPIFQSSVKYEARAMAIDRFRREIEVTSSIDSPSVVRLLDHGSYKTGDEDSFFFVMEYVPWPTLKHWIKEYDSISPIETVGIMIRVLEGLKAIHERGPHRDIKPENIMISPDGKRIVIMDLGLAKDVGSPSEGEGLTQTGMAVGTPQYMAPEQTRDTKHTDKRADLFSLGVIFYEMLTKKMPFGSKGDGALQIMMAVSDKKVKAVPPSKTNPSVDKDLDAIVLKALAKEPNLRYQNAADIVGDLEAWLVQNEGSRSDEIAQSRVQMPRFSEKKKAEIIKRRPIASDKSKSKGAKGYDKLWLYGGGIAGAIAVSAALFFGASPGKKTAGTTAQVTTPVNTTSPPKVNTPPKVDPPKVDPQPKVNPLPQTGKPVAAENLVAHFTFDEIRPDGTVVDSSKGLVGKVHGAKIVPGKIGNALRFDGVKDYVSLGNPASLDLTGDFTFSAWIRSLDDGKPRQFQPIISKGNHQYGFRIHSNRLSIFFYNSLWTEMQDIRQKWPEVSSSEHVKTNQWSYVVGRKSGAELTLWLDDVRYSHQTKGSIASTKTDVEIGRDHDLPERLFSGDMDDIRIFNKALSDEEVKQIFERGSKGLSDTDPGSGTKKPGGGRLAAEARLDLGPEGLKNVASFAVKLWHARPNEAGNDFALNFGEFTKILRIVEDTKDEEVVSLALLVKSDEGESPFLVIDRPRKKLEEIQKKGGVEGELTAQDIQSALSLSVLNARMAVPSPANNSAVNYGIEIPLSYFAQIGDAELFRSQLASALAQASQHYEHSRRASRQVTFLFPGREGLADWQVRILNELTKNLPYHLNLNPKSKKFDGVVVELLEAENLKGQPQSDGKRLFVSIGSLSENSDAVLSWHKAFAIADWLGGRYALDSDTGVIDFTQVRGSDSDLQRVLTYYQTHQENTSTKIQADVFIRMVEGKASSDEYLEYALNLPILKKVPLHILIQAARLALKAIGASA